jgi:1,4-alpha-glucan branching enzyme
MEQSSHMRQVRERGVCQSGPKCLRTVAFIFWSGHLDEKTVEVVIESRPAYRQTDAFQTVELNREASGYFSGVVPAAADGTLYRYRLNSGSDLFPDPVSRFRPEGPHRPSQVLDPDRFRWKDSHWLGVALPGQIICEMHIGTLCSPLSCEGLFSIWPAGINTCFAIKVTEKKRWRHIPSTSFGRNDLTVES